MRPGTFALAAGATLRCCRHRWPRPRLPRRRRVRRSGAARGRAAALRWRSARSSTTEPKIRRWRLRLEVAAHRRQRRPVPPSPVGGPRQPSRCGRRRPRGTRASAARRATPGRGTTGPSWHHMSGRPGWRRRQRTGASRRTSCWRIADGAPSHRWLAHTRRRSSQKAARGPGAACTRASRRRAAHTRAVLVCLAAATRTSENRAGLGAKFISRASDSPFASRAWDRQTCFGKERSI